MIYKIFNPYLFPDSQKQDVDKLYAKGVLISNDQIYIRFRLHQFCNNTFSVILSQPIETGHGIEIKKFVIERKGCCDKNYFNPVNEVV